MWRIIVVAYPGVEAYGYPVEHEEKHRLGH
jgi:hypothetical protein